MEQMTKAAIRGICVYWIRMCWQIRNRDAWCKLQCGQIIRHHASKLRELGPGTYLEHMPGYDRPLALRGVPAFVWDGRPNKLPRTS